MKTTAFLSLAFAASALVIPDLETAKSLNLQVQDDAPSDNLWDSVKPSENFWNDLSAKAHDWAGCAKHKFDDALEAAYDTAVKYDEKFETAIAGSAWLKETDDIDLFEAEPEHPPHHGPPHHGPPHDGPPHHGPPHRRPEHPPHHGPPNRTVYELISESKYTTKLAKAIDEFPDLVKLLNGTKANYTVFAPTDAAFDKIPKHAPKPSKEFLKKLLTYHVSPEFYPAGRVLTSRTIPSALDAEFIKDVPQRLSTQVSFRGLTVNFYARIVAIDIFGTNGVIHGIDSILLPPPKVVDIITALPGEFSTLELALYKTDLFKAFNDTSLHNGGTLFAPSNFAFKRLGPRINAFLFSQYGLKYLKALLLYHAADDITLYSDAIYKTDDDSKGGHGHDGGPHRIPKGFYHIDLPTGLEGKHLSIDIGRYGRLISIKINGFTRVSVSDGIAADGVIHVVPNVLIPPKTPGGPGGIADESMSVEDFKAAFEPFVDQNGSEEGQWQFDL